MYLPSKTASCGVVQELVGDVIRDNTVDVHEIPAGTTEARKRQPVLASYKHKRERPFAPACAVHCAVALA